jgi:hypothetical protein
LAEPRRITVGRQDLNDDDGTVWRPLEIDPTDKHVLNLLTFVASDMLQLFDFALRP